MEINPAKHPPVRETYINTRVMRESQFREDVSDLTDRMDDVFDEKLYQVIPLDYMSQAKDLMFYDLLSAEQQNRGENDELTTSYGHQRLANNAEQNRGALKAMGLQAWGEERRLSWTSDQVPESVKRDLGCDAIQFEFSRFGRNDFEVTAETKWVNSQPPINGSTEGSGLLYWGKARLDGPLTKLSDAVRDGSRPNVRWYTNHFNALDTDTRVWQREIVDEPSRAGLGQHVGPREVSEQLSEPARDFYLAVTAEMGMPGWLTFDETGR